MKAKATVQGRRVVPAIRRKVGKKVVTLGDLISAAFDTVKDLGQVSKVLSSRELARATGRRIVVI